MAIDKRKLTADEKKQINQLTEYMLEMNSDQRHDFIIYAEGAAMAARALRKKQESVWQKLEKLPDSMQVAVTSYLEGMVAAYDCQRREADE